LRKKVRRPYKTVGDDDVDEGKFASMVEHEEEVDTGEDDKRLMIGPDGAKALACTSTNNRVTLTLIRVLLDIIMDKLELYTLLQESPMQQ
jgi:hypothetical protein